MLRFLCLLALAMVAAVSQPSLLGAADRPNILLITADDLGLQLGCYGDKVVRTPNLDALAKRGRLFENAYVGQASCSPSRSAMFTGLFPHANGQYGLVNGGFELHEPLRSQTIPALLKQAGYRTGILGKLHVAPDKSFPFDVRLKADTRDVKAAAAQAATFFRGEDGPFFLMANFADPHVKNPNAEPPNEVFPSQYAGVPENPLKIGEVPPLPFQQIDTPKQMARVTQYYNAVMRFDAGLGLLMAELESSGKAANTVILLVGDHGPPFFRGKTSCYEGGVHVPMIAVWPGVFTAGDRTPAFTSTVDLLPTILDAAGLPARPLHGVSLRSTLDPAKHRPYLSTEFHYHGAAPFFPRRTIRDSRFKLIHNLRAGQTLPSQKIDGDDALIAARSEKYAGSKIGQAFKRAANPPEYELYDLQSDPWEFENLADRPDHAKKLAQLKDALMEWRKSTDDPLLTEEGFAFVAKPRPIPESARKRNQKRRNQ